MKINTIILSAFFLAASVSCATAATFTSSGTTTSLTNTTSVLSTFKTSTNVTLTVNVDSTGTNYAAASYHLNGNREFGTASGSTLLYYKDKTPGSAPSGSFTAENSGEFTTGWSSL